MIKKIFCLVCFSSVMFASAQTMEKTKVVEDGLRFCESSYPYKGGVLIANFGTEQLNPLNNEGKGYIAYYKDGKTSIMIPADGNLSAPKGMSVKGNYIYVCDVNKIVVYNINNTKKTPYTIQFPKDDLFVNDVVIKGNNLYASVTNTDKIYKIDISNPSAPGKPEEWVSIAGPNGLFLHKGKMYVASYPADGVTKEDNVLYRIDNLRNPKPEKVIKIPGQYDGLALSKDGKSIYISNWSPAGLYRLNIKNGEMTPLELDLQKPLVGPADISTDGKKIYVPDLPNSRVIVIKE